MKKKTKFKKQKFAKVLAAIFMCIATLLSTAVPALAAEEDPAEPDTSYGIFELFETLKELNEDNQLTNLYYNFSQFIKHGIIQLGTEIAYMIDGETTLSDKGVTVTFSNKTFDVSPTELKLYVKKISVSEAGDAPDGYCDYVLLPYEGDFNPIAYRIAIVDNNGKAHRTSSMELFRKFKVKLTTPSEWGDSTKIYMSKYEWVEEYSRHDEIVSDRETRVSISSNGEKTNYISFYENCL